MREPRKNFERKQPSRVKTLERTYDDGQSQLARGQISNNSGTEENDRGGRV